MVDQIDAITTIPVMPVNPSSSKGAHGRAVEPSAKESHLTKAWSKKAHAKAVKASDPKPQSARVSGKKAPAKSQASSSPHALAGERAPARRSNAPAKRSWSGSGTEVTRKLIREMGAELDALKKRLLELSRISDEPADEFAEAAQVFADEVRSLVGEAAPDPAAVRRAARIAVAEQAWTQRLGTLLETRDVVELLAVSKQRVSTLVRDHRLIALPQAGRMRFPAWQFATAEPEDRECIAAAHQRLTELGAVSPWTAASWFREDHPELDDQDPIAFLRAGGERSRLLAVAARDAARLAQ